MEKHYLLLDLQTRHGTFACYRNVKAKHRISQGFAETLVKFLLSNRYRKSKETPLWAEAVICLFKVNPTRLGELPSLCIHLTERVTGCKLAAK